MKLSSRDELETLLFHWLTSSEIFPFNTEHLKNMLTLKSYWPGGNHPCLFFLLLSNGSMPEAGVNKTETKEFEFFYIFSLKEPTYRS